MDSALAYFSEAARLDPRSQMVVFEVATTTFMQRRYDAVLTLLQQARAIAPQWAPATLSMANVRLYMGQRDSSSAAYAPLALLTGWLHTVAKYNPATQILEAARQGFVGGVTWGDTWPGLLALAGLATLFTFFALRGMRRMTY